MQIRKQFWIRTAAGCSAIFLGTFAINAATLSSNLIAATTDVETASGDTWLTASFGTDSSGYMLGDVTLLLANSGSGVAEVDLYSDGGLQPGSFIAALSSPSTYSSSLSPITFTSSGVTLAAGSTYWIVLKALAGDLDWAWTDDNTGTGAGFQNTWGETSDAGATWFTYDIYPLQFSVDAASSAVPEPGTATFLMGGCALLGALAWKRFREDKEHPHE